MATIEVGKDNFDETIGNNGIVFVDFWASWCGPCKAFAPVYEKAAEENTDIVFAKVNPYQPAAGADPNQVAVSNFKRLF